MNNQISPTLSGGLLGLGLQGGATTLANGLPGGFSQGGFFAGLLGQSLMATTPGGAGQAAQAGQGLPAMGLNLPPQGALMADGLPPATLPLSEQALQQLASLQLSEEALQELAEGQLSADTLQQLTAGQLSDELVADLQQQGFPPELQQQLLQELDALAEQQQPLAAELAVALRQRLGLSDQGQTENVAADSGSDSQVAEATPAQPANDTQLAAAARDQAVETTPVLEKLPLVLEVAAADERMPADAAAQQALPLEGAIQNRALARMLSNPQSVPAADDNSWLTPADQAMQQVQQMQPGAAVAAGLSERLEQTLSENRGAAAGMSIASTATATAGSAGNTAQAVQAAQQAAQSALPQADGMAEQAPAGTRSSSMAQAVAAANSTPAQGVGAQAAAVVNEPVVEGELDPVLAERLRNLAGDGADGSGRESSSQNSGSGAGGQNGAPSSGFAQLVRQAATEPSAAQQQPQQFNLPGSPHLKSPNWPSALGERVVWLANQQSRVAEIQLDPPELGSLQVRIQVNQDQVSVSFVSPHASVRDTVEQSLVRLREMFAEQGLNLADSSVADHSSGERHEGRDGESGERAGYAQSGLGGDEELSQQDGAQGLSLVDYYA
ncbi:flagellar hook-length control protein FliK [Marinobacterium arenosum]|uniref:flagellar hook-length control protein FliK n=1 Tax=Marinobacterium arenosum TaxID=2862496 RepID=UPI001C9766F2|nr:flagellar hook-length control protein FliK [Marinobacterium arenosum]MBY4675950.1 flagellar hook-length control protein FliK [Marinobacterium arenosum]